MFNLFASFLIWVIKSWCTWRGRVRVIRRPAKLAIGEPYLIRYALTGWQPGDRSQRRWLNLPQIYLHHILLPDADPAPHNHPWPWARSLILRGSYYEKRLIGLYTLRRLCSPGDCSRLTADTFHRIADVTPGTGCWTLFITSGGKRQPWGFAVPGQGFVPHAERKAMQ